MIVQENKYTAKEVAKMTRYSIPSIYKYFREGKIRGIQQNSSCKILFPESAVEEFMKQGISKKEE